jgi:hypothetical protein
VYEKEMLYERTHMRTHTPAKRFFLVECQKAAKDIQEIFNREMDKAF